MVESPNSWESLKDLLLVVFGAGGIKVLEVIVKRFFPSQENKAAAEKTAKEGQHISLTGEIAAYQVAEQSLTSFIKIARNATKELFFTTQKCNDTENVAEDALRLVERLLNLPEKEKAY